MDDSLDDRSPHTRSSLVTRRRLLQAGGGITTVSMSGFAGCIGDSQSSDDSEESQSSEDSDNSPSPENSDDSPSPEEFEMCGAAAIDINALPNPARTEVETALEDGQYETEEELYLPHLMDIDSSYLIPGSWLYRNAEVAYRALVNQDGATTTLKLEEAIPTHGKMPLEIHNEGDEQVTVEIHITRLRTDETLLAETFTIDPGSTTETAAFDRQIGADGEYRITINSEDQISIPNWEDGGSDGWTTQWREYSDESPYSFIQIDGEPEPRPQLHLYECASWARS